MKKHLAIAAALVAALAAPVAATAAPSPTASNTATTTGADGTAKTLTAQYALKAGANTTPRIVVEGTEQSAGNLVLETNEIAVVSFDAKVVDGDYEDIDWDRGVTLTFNVGAQYAGATAEVYADHEHMDDEVFKTTVAADGSISITVHGLSVFTVTIDKTTIGSNASGAGKDTSAKSPQTGVSISAAAATAAVSAVAAAGCVVYAVRKEN